MAEQRFATTGPVRLDIKIAVGDIEVVTTDELESTISISGPQRLVDATSVELAGNRLVVQHQRKLFSGFFERFDGALNVEARVPAGSRVAIATASADARLVGAFAELDINSVSGGVGVTGTVDGDAAVKTVSGEVVIDDVSADLSVRSVSGNITAGKVGGSLTVKSVSGDVYVRSLSEGTVNVQNVSGNVELGIAPDTNLDVDAGSASGQLSSEVQLSDVPGLAPGRKLIVRSRSVSGDVRLVRAA